MDDGVSVWHMDVPYGNSRPARGPGARSAEGGPPGVCFFDSFFAQAKKEGPRGERRLAGTKRRFAPPGRRTKSPSRARTLHRETEINGLRCPSPQPLSRWERGFSRYARTRMNSYL